MSKSTDNQGVSLILGNGNEELSLRLGMWLIKEVGSFNRVEVVSCELLLAFKGCRRCENTNFSVTKKRKRSILKVQTALFFKYKLIPYSPHRMEILGLFGIFFKIFSER